MTGAINRNAIGRSTGFRDICANKLYCKTSCRRIADSPVGDRPVATRNAGCIAGASREGLRRTEGQTRRADQNAGSERRGEKKGPTSGAANGKRPG